jgi:hypothetical protein
MKIGIPINHLIRSFRHRREGPARPAWASIFPVVPLQHRRNGPARENFPSSLSPFRRPWRALAGGVKPAIALNSGGSIMRHPSAAPSVLPILLAAISDERLVALIVALARNGPSAGAAAAAGDDEPDAAAAPSPSVPQPIKKQSGWPKGKRRVAGSIDAVKLARLKRNADNRRAARARKASTGNGTKPNGAGKSNGHDDAKGNGAGKLSAAGNGALTPAATLWRHAMTLQPKFPWRLLSRELGINEAQALDAYRRGELPPGLSDTAVTRFLELPVA